MLVPNMRGGVATCPSQSITKQTQQGRAVWLGWGVTTMPATLGGGLMVQAHAAAAKAGSSGQRYAPLVLALQRSLRVSVVLGALASAVSARSESTRAQKDVELSSHQPVQLAGPAERGGFEGVPNT